MIGKFKAAVESIRTGYRQAMKVHEAEPDASIRRAVDISREYKANRDAGFSPDESRSRIGKRDA